MATPRFLTLADVADILNVTWRQVYALVRRKELIAIQIGGRGQWRVEATELERFIAQKYDEARAGTVPEELDGEAVADAAARDSTAAENGSTG
jgi:excisionase family DNA binding protein